MRFRSTRGGLPPVGLGEAVRLGLSPDGGLFQPVDWPHLPAGFLERPAPGFAALAADLAALILGGDMPPARAADLAAAAFDFPVPLAPLDGRPSVLELFHGPTLAFKDFGARFLARLLAWLQRGEERPLTVLVATSGDTGSAVAHGFHGVAGVEVVVLYPRGRISDVQERQIATLGGNVQALAVDGSFDDCQRLLKRALADPELRRRRQLTTANSINIGRLLPQVFYYIHGWLQLGPRRGQRVAVAVPSGNFGNLTAAVLARRMGLPLDRMIAATTVNDTVPRFLAGGRWDPKPVQATLASAMDVAVPSNFERLRDLYAEDLAAMRQEITARPVEDGEIRMAVRRVHGGSGYVMDPHTATAWLALHEFLSGRGGDWAGFSLATADPAKFATVIEPLIGEAVPVPDRLRQWLDRPLRSLPMPADFGALREWLLAAC